MISFLWLTVLVLVSYRVTRFLVLDSMVGFNVDSGSWLSEWLDAAAWGSSIWSRLVDFLSCPLCVGFHVSWVVTSIWARMWPWYLGVDGWMIVFAVAGGSALLFRRVD